MAAIERGNPAIKGVLPKDYARPALDKLRLGQIIELAASLRISRAGAACVGLLVNPQDFCR